MTLRCVQTSLVLCIAIACGFVAAFEACTVNNLTDIVSRGSFTGDAFWHGRVTNVPDCAVACVRRSLCMGFNYNPMEELCEMFGALTNNRTRWPAYSANTMYSYIANWTSEIEPNCFSRPCPINAVCMPGSFGGDGGDCSYTCINFTMLCPKPSASFSGPRSVGSTVLCDDGQNSTCLETLQWSKTCMM